MSNDASYGASGGRLPTCTPSGAYTRQRVGCVLCTATCVARRVSGMRVTHSRARACTHPAQPGDVDVARRLDDAAAAQLDGVLGTGRQLVEPIL